MEAFRRTWPRAGRRWRRRPTGHTTPSPGAYACSSPPPPAAFCRRLTGVGAAGLRRLLRISGEVADALAANKPVVALESTIYTHGAIGELGLEDVVRQNGGVPAVCGILAGTPTIGLTPAEVARMARESPRKVSRRDVAYVVGMKSDQPVHGGTTIAGTMLLARLAGIRVLGTGGLGGVHRGGQDSFDISADLNELGRTRVAVVSSGCKGFLDVRRTLEYLETQGVMVSTFADARTGAVDFPAFWARDSGVRSPFVVQDEEQAAATILAQEDLGIESGMLFANPISEQASIPKDEMNVVIDRAVRDAEQSGAQGHANTPFILKRIRELTSDRSTTANTVLVRANVERATKIAVAVSRILSAGPDGGKTPSISRPAWQPQTTFRLAADDQSGTNKAAAGGPKVESQASVLVAGSVAVDLSCDYSVEGAAPASLAPQLHTSNPAQIRQSVGGVGRNVAIAAHRVGVRGSSVTFCSVIGNDLAGSVVLKSLQASGLDTSQIRQLGPEDDHPASRTAQYIAVNDANKNLVLAMADMDIFTAHNFPPLHWSSVIQAAKPSWMVVDANWGESDLRSWTAAGKQHHAKVVFEPVSSAKAARLFCRRGGRPVHLGVYPQQRVDLAAPNQYELAAMHAAAQDHEYLDDPRWWSVIDAFGLRGARDRFVRSTSSSMTDEGIPQQAVQLLPYIPTIVTKMGHRGALLTMLLGKDDPRLRDAAAEPFVLARCPTGHPDLGGVYVRLFPAVEEVADVVSVNGVGDTFLGVLVAGLARGGKIERLVDVAQKGAVMTLRSSESVGGDLATLEGELAAAAS